MKDAMLVAFGVVLVLSGTGLVVGLFSASLEDKSSNCFRSASRIEYVLPTYRLGCWLGGKP